MFAWNKIRMGESAREQKNRGGENICFVYVSMCVCVCVYGEGKPNWIWTSTTFINYLEHFVGSCDRIIVKQQQKQ